MKLTRQQQQDVKADVIHAALSIMYREDFTDEQRDEARKQIARIEKLFGYVPNSFRE